MSSPEKTIASGRPKRRAAQPPPVGVEGRDAATGSCGGMIRRTPESARQCGKRGARYHHAHDCGDGRGEAGFTNLDQGPMVSVLPPSIHACRPVGDPCSTPSRPRIGDAKLVNHAQGSKGRGHIVARGARDGPAGMPRLVQRAMLALAILAALVVGASARDHAPAGIDGGQTSGALFAAQQVASVDDASSGGLPRVHRARKLIEADPRYGSAVRRVLNDVESGGNWSQVGADIDGEAADDMSGYSVSISADGTRVAIGTGGNDGTGTDAGHVRVYAESGGTWTQVGADIDGEAAGDYFGNSVSMSSDGTRVAIGASGNNGNGNNAGHVRVYSESGGTWTQVGADIDGEAAGDWSGWSVSMSSDGTRVAIGAIYLLSGGIAGHVRVYAESGGTWTQVGAVIVGEAANDRFGYSVSMSSDGTRLAIGAIDNDGTGTDSGHVRVYAESGGTWTQVGADIDGEAAGDWSGRSVSMSSDGTRVAIGATKNDGTGTDSGHVRVYAESGGTWTQVGADIDGEAADDWTGWSVSMSSDGTRVAIGAIYNDGTGTDAGHVRVYDAPLCAASADPNKDGSDGIFYCINGGTIGGATGSCTCTPCNAGYEGVSCQTASTQSCTCTQNICSCKLTDGTLTAFWTTNIKGIPYKGYEGYEEYFAA